jgi:phosphatidate cytidylyltransferase
MKRVLTTLVLIPSICYVVLRAPEWLFYAVLVSVALVCFYEYSGLVAAHSIPKPGPIGFACGLVLLAVPQEFIVFTALMFVVLAAAMLFQDLSKSLPWASALALGCVYVFGAWRCAVPLRAINPHWLLLALVINWIGDTAAYGAGKTLGRHKLFPRVSPNKSWEGGVASLLVSTVCGVLYIHWFLPATPPLWSVLLCAAGNVAGQIGDLAESAIKRGAGVKDSSGLLPGHGGWLDRVDSSLFALPTIYGLLLVYSSYAK